MYTAAYIEIESSLPSHGSKSTGKCPACARAAHDMGDAALPSTRCSVRQHLTVRQCKTAHSLSLII